MLFINSFGAIALGGFYLNQYSNNLIPFENVKRVKITKTRSYNLNIFFTTNAIVVLGSTIFFLDQKSSLVFCGYLLSLLFFLTGFFYKKNKYQFIVVNKDRDSFTIDVDAKVKDDAKKISTEINEKIKNLEKTKYLEKTLSNKVSNILEKEEELILN
jgi:hypothetical protein